MSEASSGFKAIGELPLVRRMHQALAVGLAVFMLTLVVLREPFHGYLAEVKISGPSTAGLDLDEAVQWLKKIEPHLATVATPAGEISAKCEIRATYVARHPRQAISHLDELADQWLYQYLPDRLQTFRRGTLAGLRKAVNELRQREDAAQERLEGLRQRQVAEAVRGPGTGDRGQQVEIGGQRSEVRDQQAISTAPGKVGSGADGVSKLRERLEGLRVQLSHLLGSHTEEHPEIVTLKSQIDSLERQLGLSESNGQPADNLESIQQAGGRQTQAAAPQGIRQTSGELAFGEQKNEGENALAIEIGAAMGELTKASRERQAAEQHLTERMQELSSGPTAGQWSSGPAQVVTRLGGTPRSLTLALAGILACASAAAMFRLTAVESAKVRIETVIELASAIALPVVGNLQGSRESGVGSRPARLSRWKWITPQRLKVVTTFAEGFVAVAAGACLISVAIDPSLAREVFADPFGTLSEVMGRFGA